MITRPGLGETLYETAEIAFDTQRGMFFNPKNKVDYGTKPPPGGWEIPWYGTPDGKVNVIVGDGGVAKTQAEAEIMKNNVTASLIAQATKDPVNYGMYAAQAATAAGSTITPATGTATGIVSTIQVPAWFKEEMVSGMPNWALAAVVLIGGYFFTKRGR